MMREAANFLDSKAAMQIRYLETITTLGRKPTTKVVFLPDDWLAIITIKYVNLFKVLLMPQCTFLATSQVLSPHFSHTYRTFQLWIWGCHYSCTVLQVRLSVVISMWASSPFSSCRLLFWPLEYPIITLPFYCSLDGTSQCLGNKLFPPCNWISEVVRSIRFLFLPCFWVGTHHEDLVVMVPCNVEWLNRTLASSTEPYEPTGR